MQKRVRFNAVAPGVVDASLHKNDPKDLLKTLQPMGRIGAVKVIVDAVLYLAHAGQVTGKVLHVDVVPTPANGDPCKRPEVCQP
jgi:NAD(P)-dependent dehydrogenase (short-subunit alcohol dehydrogenase family)